MCNDVNADSDVSRRATDSERMPTKSTAFRIPSSSSSASPSSSPSSCCCPLLLVLLLSFVLIESITVKRCDAASPAVSKPSGTSFSKTGSRISSNKRGSSVRSPATSTPFLTAKTMTTTTGTISPQTEGNKRLNSSKAAGYTFTYIRQQGNRTLTRTEEQDPAGLLKGIYWIQDPNGIYRLISYQAHPDQRFRAQVLTNRPGEVNQTFPDVSEDDQDDDSTTSASLITTTTLMATSRPSSASIPSSSHHISCSKGEAANGGIENLMMMSTSSTNTESTTETGSTDETTNESTTTDTDVSTSNEPTETTTTDTSSTTSKESEDDDGPPAPLPEEGDINEDDALRYFLEYRVFVDGGGSIYRKEGTDESGRVIGTYMFLVDDNKESQQQQRSISGRKKALKPKIKTVDTGVTSASQEHKDAAFIPLIRYPLMTARLRRQEQQIRGA